MNIEDRLFQLLRLGLDLDSERDNDFYIPQDEWPTLFKLLRDHALLGIGFAGLQRLENPNIPKPLLLKWIAATEQIKRRNQQMDKAVADLSRQLEQDGWLFCILKGQTAARLYPQPELRQSGDIDVWIYGKKDGSKPSRKEIIRYLESNHPGEHSLKCTGRRVKLCYLHADGITINGNVSVEVHFLPSFSVSPFKNRRLQKALSQYEPNSFEFNRLYMLHHIYRHLFSEGIGLRQLIDYAMLLSHKHGSTSSAFEDVLRSLGMQDFAQGVAWILNEKLHLPSSYLYCELNKNEGHYLLNKILNDYNYIYSETKNEQSTRLFRFMKKTKHNLAFIRHYPSEVLYYIPFIVWETFVYKILYR